MLPARGRPGQTILFEIERELKLEDILRLATDENLLRVGPPTIQKISDNHHAIARHLASGKTVLETADLCGMSAQRVGDLARTDPAFRNLLAFYRDQVQVSGIDEAQTTFGDLRFIGRASREEIKRRLEDPSALKEMDIDQLRRLNEMSMDRTDAPPRTAQNQPTAPTHITFNMGPRKIEPKIIDQNPSESPVLEIEFEENENAKGS